MPATEIQLKEIEERFGYSFPSDYRFFLSTRGSLEEFLGKDFLQLFSIDQLLTMNQAGQIQQRFPGAMVIGGDGSREMLAYDFRDGRTGLVLLDITAADWSSAIPQRKASPPSWINFQAMDGILATKLNEHGRFRRITNFHVGRSAIH